MAEDPLDTLGTMLDPPSSPPDDLYLRVLDAAARPHGRLRGKPGMPRFVVSGGLALVLLLGAGAVLALRYHDHVMPASAGSVGASGASGPAATGSSSVSLAALVLDDAAGQAEKDADLHPRADQFVFIETETWAPVRATTPAGPTAVPGKVRSWLSADGSRDGLTWFENPVPGQPAEVPMPGCRNGRASEWGPNGTLLPNQTRPCQPDPAFLGGLPTATDRMLSYLYTSGSLPGMVVPVGGSPDLQAFNRVLGLLQGRYVAPAARAALFRATARIPGVSALTGVVDAAGRTGIAITAPGSGGRGLEIVFDANTYELLGWQLAPAVGGPVQLQFRPTAVLQVAVVDQVGQLP